MTFALWLLVLLGLLDLLGPILRFPGRVIAVDSFRVIHKARPGDLSNEMSAGAVIVQILDRVHY